MIVVACNPETLDFLRKLGYGLTKVFGRYSPIETILLGLNLTLGSNSTQLATCGQTLEYDLLRDSHKAHTAMLTVAKAFMPDYRFRRPTTNHSGAFPRRSTTTLHNSGGEIG